MKHNILQVMLHSTSYLSKTVKVKYPGIVVTKVHQPENKHYLFVDLLLLPTVKPGKLDFVFEEEIASDKVVMDLFCGTGTIGQLLAKRNPNVKIVGVDIVEEAIEDAKRNAKKNNINSISFFASDVGKFLKEYPNYQRNISSIVLDPPRAGIAPKTLQKVIELGAENIVYISCNPSTQARDAATLRDAGFELEKYALVDQFPHTGHIESIAKFKRK
jgi:tRNA/tmRNA/rRNA uracil-C5-methylase (TrmA/RlmC/RlmD family)